MTLRSGSCFSGHSASSFCEGRSVSAASAGTQGPVSCGFVKRRKREKEKKKKGQKTRRGKCPGGRAYLCGIGGRRQIVIGLDNNRKSTLLYSKISIKVAEGGGGGGGCNKAYSPLLSNNWPSNEESLIRNPRSMRPSSSALGAPVNLVQSASQPVSQSASQPVNTPLWTLSLHIPEKKRNSPYIFSPIQPRQVPDIKNHPLHR